MAGLAVAAFVTGGALALLGSFRTPLVRDLKRLVSPTPADDPTQWPNDAAKLRLLDPDVPKDFGTFRVFLDPGHGAKGNTGNVSSYCQDEQDFTLALAKELGAYLRRSGHFEVRLSRPTSALVEYRDRVRAAEKWKAHAFVSLHSDVRGESEPWSPEPGTTCLRSEQAPGFSVLWSDERPDAARRLGFARVMARSMTEAGFLPYHGHEYRDLYEGDEVAGVFVDRHAPGKRIFVLRTPTMPSILVETHNALDPREVRRWAGRETREAFFAAVRATLVAYLGGEAS